MSQKTIFARARPRIIRVTENYPYKTEISTVSHTDPDQGRVGLIEISVPYDGWKHFRHEALKDIKKQKKQSKDVREARIGHLSFAEYGRTNLDERFDLSLHHSVLPLDIPFEGNGLGPLNKICNDRYSCEIALSYTPEQPEFGLLSIELEVYDETEIKEKQGVLKEQGQSAQSDIDRLVAEQISQQTGFESSLLFAFVLKLKLPKHIQPIDNDKLPRLSRMALEWPVNTSHQVVHVTWISRDGKEQPTAVVYDPEQKAIEWSDIPFMADESSESDDVHPYHIPLMLLSVDEPGELYQIRELSGSVRIEIPYSYSGTRLSYLDASGKHEQGVTIEYCTILTSQLKVDVHTCFERKVYSPYQLLQFPNVVLNDMRRADVMALLKDEHFTWQTKPRDLSEETESGKQYLIQATRPEGAGQLKLWILLQGTPSRTKREKKIPGEETFTTEFNTGSTHVYIRGQLRGDSMRVVAVINEIHERLKERFRHVSVLD